jgi:hypothetical protein
MPPPSQRLPRSPAIDPALKPILRARIVFLSAERLPVQEVARQMGASTAST